MQTETGGQSVTEHVCFCSINVSKVHKSPLLHTSFSGCTKEHMHIDLIDVPESRYLTNGSEVPPSHLTSFPSGYTQLPFRLR